MWMRFATAESEAKSQLLIIIPLHTLTAPAGPVTPGVPAPAPFHTPCPLLCFSEASLFSKAQLEGPLL